MDAIVGATSLAAESMGLGQQIGALAPGLQADLVAVKGNPLAGHRCRAPGAVRDEGRPRLQERSGREPSSEADHGARPTCAAPCCSSVALTGAVRHAAGDPGVAGLWRRCRRRPSSRRWPTSTAPTWPAWRQQWEWTTGRRADGGVRHAARQLPEHAADDRQRALREHALQPRGGARRRDRTRAVGVRPARPTRTASRRTAPASCIAASRAWRDGGKLRIFLNSRYRLICLDAATGQAGRQLRHQRQHRPQQRPDLADREEALHEDVAAGGLSRTSIILGNGVGDRLVYKNDPPGDIRAFDARTGKQVWTFHTIPQRGEAGPRDVGRRALRATPATPTRGRR